MPSSISFRHGGGPMVRPRGTCRTRGWLRVAPACAALAVVLLPACRRTPPEEDAAARASHLADTEMHVATTQSDSLELSLEAPARVRAGVEIPLTIRVVNTGERTVDLYLRGRDIAFDLILANAAGDVVWRRLRDEVIQAILRVETLPPGDTLELIATWDQRSNDGESLGPGTYMARGEILTEGDALVTPTVTVHVGSD
jgi:hypothetical protein